MLSVFIREFLLPLLFFLFLRSFLRGVFNSFRRPLSRRANPRATPPPPVHTGGVLHKDPVCGVYIPGETAIAQTVGGQTVYFCSPECRDKYRTSQ